MCINGVLVHNAKKFKYFNTWGGEFVLAIMIYYVIIYLIKEYATNKIPHLLILTLFVAVIVYIFFFPYKYETSSKGIYGITTLYRWVPYFGFMLLGSWMGLKRSSLKFRPALDFLLLLINLALFYGIQFLAKKVPEYAPYQIVTLLPLSGIVFYFYKWCNAGFWNKLYKNKVWNWLIMTVSGLCLESYLIQHSVFTTKMNGIFPLNLPIMIIIVLLASYICKCLSRIFAQTFNDKDYEWKEVFKAY